MKKIFKLLMMAVGAFAMVAGSTSCSKDDEKECCTYSYDGDTMKFCEGDAELEEYGYTWKEFKALAALSDDITCD